MTRLALSGVWQTSKSNLVACLLYVSVNDTGFDTIVLLGKLLCNRK